MADWPELAELIQVLDVPNGATDWETTLSRALANGISYVKSVRGDWDEDVDEPTDNLAGAALRMAELLATRPDSDNTRDKTFLRLMTGQRRRFGIG